MTTAAGPTDRPVASAGLVDSPPQVSTGSQPDRPRQIGFAARPVVTVEPAQNVAPNVAANVAPATKKRGPGHISDQSAGHIPAPAPGPDWDAVRVPDRGEERSYFSGPIYWKFRTDRGCWRVQFKATPAAPALDLGNIGKRDLAALDALPDRERTAAILGKVRGWLEEKGIARGE